MSSSVLVIPPLSSPCSALGLCAALCPSLSLSSSLLLASRRPINSCFQFDAPTLERKSRDVWDLESRGGRAGGRSGCVGQGRCPGRRHFALVPRSWRSCRGSAGHPAVTTLLAPTYLRAGRPWALPAPRTRQRPLHARLHRWLSSNRVRRGEAAECPADRLKLKDTATKHKDEGDEAA